MLNPETVKSILEKQDELVERSVQETSLEALGQLASYLETSTLELAKIAEVLSNRAKINLRLAREVKEFLSTVGN